MNFWMQKKCLLISLALLSTLSAIPTKAEDIYLGSVAMDIPIEMAKRLGVLSKYLGEQTGLSIKFRASPNLGSAVDDLGAGHTQIAYLTPVAYLQAHDKFGAVPLVAPLNAGRPTFELVIAVRNDSPFKTVEDLRNKRFAFGDEKALLQKAAVEGMGIKVTEFSKVAYLNHYDNIAKAVLNGDFDAGILTDNIAEEFKSKGIRVLKSSPPLPSYNFAVSKDIPKEAADKLKTAFLALKRNTPANVAVLDGFEKGYDGFVPTNDAAYDIVRKMIAPYKKP
jgi:phosphonate transport system substrate-binding protein